MAMTLTPGGLGVVYVMATKQVNLLWLLYRSRQAASEGGGFSYHYREKGHI